MLACMHVFTHVCMFVNVFACVNSHALTELLSYSLKLPTCYIVPFPSDPQ